MWAPLLAENIADPYGMYKTLRVNEPVYKAQTGEWVLTRYNDIRGVLKDERFKAGNKKEWIDKGITYFKNKDQDLSRIAEAINHFLLMINPPEHTRIRKFLTQIWSQVNTDEIIDNNVRLLVKSMETQGKFDLVEDFARPLPNMTICAILGIDDSDYKELAYLSNRLVKILDLYNSLKDLVTIDEAAGALIAYFKKLLYQKQQQQSDDFVCKLIFHNKQQAEPLSNNAMVSIIIFLFIAGQETTVGLLSTGLLNLYRFKEQRSVLTRNPDLMSAAIEELLRFDGPVQLLGRIAANDVVIGSQQINKGDTLTLCLGSANRDELLFDEPDQLDITRTRNRHLAFGSGIHYCLGDMLARKQAIAGIGHFIGTFPEYRLEDTDIHWNNNLSVRTLQNLPCHV